MAGIRHVLPSGTTEPQTFTAYTDDAVVDMSGLSIALEVTDRDGDLVTLTGAVAWNDATNAVWQYTPDGQLTEANSPYRVRLKLTDGTGAFLKFPNTEEADEWVVVDP